MRWRPGSCVPPAAVVEDERAPIGVCAAPRILVLVERRAVEADERELVAREVRRNPVEDHAETAGVQPIDEGAELVGRAVARGRSVVARHLIAPGAGERVLHHRHQLDVREAEAERVVGQLVRRLLVGQRAVALERVEAPGAEVHFVDRHGRGVRLGRLPRVLPGLVAPAVAGLEDDRPRARRQLGAQRERIGLEAHRPVRAPDRKLVGGAGGGLRDEELPHAGRAQGAHGV